MLAKGFEECQSGASEYVRVPSFSGSNPVQVWSLTRVFHTCGKICGKSRKSHRTGQEKPEMSRIQRRAKVGKPVKLGFLRPLRAQPVENRGSAEGESAPKASFA